MELCVWECLQIYIISYIPAEFPFELWKILDKAFGLQEIEDEAWCEPSISSCSLSQDLLASTFTDEFDHDE